MNPFFKFALFSCAISLTSSSQANTISANKSTSFQDSLRHTRIDSTSTIARSSEFPKQDSSEALDGGLLIEHKSSIDFLSALLTPLIAIIAVYIAWQQFRNAQLKLKHDLYERRLEVFKAVSQFIGTAVQLAYLKNEDLFALLRETNQSYFLFDDDVSQYIHELYLKGVDFSYINTRLHGKAPISQEERERLADKNGELLKWFSQQFEVSRKLFGKYMRIRK
jgi:hypothetical protein